MRSRSSAGVAACGARGESVPPATGRKGSQATLGGERAHLSVEGVTPGEADARRRAGTVVDMNQTPLQRHDDHELVAAFRGGLEGAFDEMHRRYSQPLELFARRMLRGTGLDAEDVVQDAFVRAHHALRAADRPMALRAWLYMITRNRALDGLRARRPCGELDERDTAGGDPVEAALQREELRRIVEELGRLPERQRLALVQRELCGTSHADLADQLGTTVSATKSLIIRARTQLREAQAA
jgi:RNA polymerase sigma factor (sigma-70 family)